MLSRPRSRGLLLTGLVIAGLLAWAGWRQLERHRSPGNAPRHPAGPESGELRELEPSRESITTEVNAKAPGLASSSLDGQAIRSIDFIGDKVLLLEFWSVFCTSCIQEMPFLSELHEKYRERGLEVVGVNTDFFTSERVAKFLARLEPRPRYPVIHDRSQEISREFNVEALPVTVLIDSEGWIRMYHLGFKPEDRDTIEDLVKKWTGRIRETVETVGAVGGRTPVDSGPGTSVERGRLPEVSGYDIGGKPFDLGDYRRGAPLALFFWSLFCQPCRQEMPLLASLAEKNQVRGIRFLSVNLDTIRMEEQVRKFLRREPLPFPTLLDARSEPPGALASRLGISYTPTLVLIDGEGMVSRVLVGEEEVATLERELGALLTAGAK